MLCELAPQAGFERDSNPQPFAGQRVTNFAIALGLDLRTCSAEDLLVLKIYASLPLEIRDAEGVVNLQPEQPHIGWQILVS